LLHQGGIRGEGAFGLGHPQLTVGGLNGVGRVRIILKQWYSLIRLSIRTQASKAETRALFCRLASPDTWYDVVHVNCPLNEGGTKNYPALITQYSSPLREDELPKVWRLR